MEFLSHLLGKIKTLPSKLASPSSWSLPSGVAESKSFAWEGVGLLWAD